MKSRALASIALGAALVLSTTGCSMLATQATTIPYAAAEGANVPNTTGPVEIRNVYFVLDEEGKDANLVGAFVNPTNTDQVANFQVTGDDKVYTVPVAAGKTVSYGNPDGEQFRIDNFPAALGTSVVVTFTSGKEASDVHVPVLDGKLSYLEGAVPTTKPTEQPSPMVTSVPSPAPTETPAS